MAGFMDILGTMVQQGMSQSSCSRMTNALGTGRANSSLNDVMGNLGQMLGGSPSAHQAGPTGSAGLGGVLGGVLGSLGNNKAAIGGLGALGLQAI